jgi:hypothetical protein
MTTPAKWKEFADKMEWEGGLTGMLEYGGSKIFPIEVRAEAKAVEAATTALRAALASHGVDDIDD